MGTLIQPHSDSLPDSLGLFYVLDFLVTKSLGAYQITSSCTCPSPSHVRTIPSWNGVGWNVVTFVTSLNVWETFLCKTYFPTHSMKDCIKYIKNQLVDRDSFVR